MTLSEYSQLKHCIVYAVGRAERHSEIISSLKELFIDKINSIRRFEQITTIGQLLNILEIRDVLSEDNVECLKKIAHKLPNTEELLQKITKYEGCPKEHRNYYVSSHNNNVGQEGSFITVNPTPTANYISPRKRQRIFQTIIAEIGSFWRDLARNLKIRECDIDDIDVQKKTMAEKATKIMHIYEYEKADPDRWFFILCNALEKSRRKDLVKSIQNIMTMNM